jgi:hypothetical protein
MSVTQDVRPERIQSLVEMQRIIPRQYLAIEADLMVSKWSAYRFMSPRQATALFIEKYAAAYKECLRVNYDVDAAVRADPTKTLDTTTNNSRYTQVWMARQYADEWGLPYDVFLEFCFDFAARRKDRRYFPQPNQLGPNGTTGEAWSEAIAKFVEDRYPLAFKRMSPMVQYTVDNHAALPAQMAFENELLAFGRTADGSLEYFIAHRMVALRQLSEATYRAAFGDELVERAIARASSDIESGVMPVEIYEPPVEGAMWQGCLGVNGIDHAVSSICGSCGQYELCGKVREIVDKQVVKTTGYSDPLREKELENGRRDVARSRAKKKAALALTRAASLPEPVSSFS